MQIINEINKPGASKDVEPLPIVARTRRRDTGEDGQGIHQLLTLRQVLMLSETFINQIGRRLGHNAFRKCLYDIAKLKFDDEEYHQLCCKLNFARTNNDIHWDEVLKYLKMGFESEDIQILSSKLELPITGAPKEIRSHHRVAIVRITFMPELEQDRKINHLYGTYITCSREGLINYWSIDMEKERTVYSQSPRLKTQTTWITDLVTLPDFNVICTSSTERDLRFYDTSAKKFELRIMIYSLDEMVTCMSYNFYTSIEKDSILLFGNTSGRVKMVHIVTKDRGPFQSMSKNPVTLKSYDQFVKGAIKGMVITDIPTAHCDWVHQVAYCDYIHCTVSVSTCSNQSMFIYNPKNKDCTYIFKINKGFTCFALAESSHIIATGGPDCLVRVWNAFVPNRALTVFRGHHAWLCSLVLQDDNIIISLDKEKCIKIWDISEQVCIQNYFGLPSSLGDNTHLCTYYNPVSRQLFVANKKIAFFQIYPLLSPEYTDGITHSKEVSVVLYNKLFNFVITCGFDSFIILWNPWNGRRLKFVTEAHTSSLHGEIIPVQITAATLDPSHQFLITGASDGTLKIWSCNLMTCTRNMSTERRSEVYAIIWIQYRILVMGENRVVTEFFDGVDIGANNYKNWMIRHHEDILCAAAYLPQTLITASYNGEIVFWRMETGQSYAIYNVKNPTERIRTQYTNPNPNKASTVKEKAYAESTNRFSSIKSHSQLGIPTRMESDESFSTKLSSLRSRAISDAGSLCNMALSVNCLLCLTGRMIHPTVGTIFAGLDNGKVQVWSHHAMGGYLSEFKAVHSCKDFVISMCTDPKNHYVYTGHMMGYIKTWLIVNYCVRPENKKYICMPLLRLKFPFMWHDKMAGRAKRAYKTTEPPILVNSYKAHLKAVTGLIYIDRVDIVISCSSDGSARIWTDNGKYLGTLGTFKPWTNISSVIPPDDTIEYALPADIQRCASFTTIKVMTGGFQERILGPKKKKTNIDNLNLDENKVFGKRLDMKNILGKHFRVLPRGVEHYNIILDVTLHDVPIFSEIHLHEPEDVTRPPTPEVARKIGKESTHKIKSS